MERVEKINERLRDYFGTAWNGQTIWRVVWSEDQLEKRFGTYDDYAGNIFLRQVTEWREVPKYRQWIQNKFVLEQLTVVPEMNQNELLDKISYEPIWVFEDKHGNALPPKFEAAKVVIDTLHAAIGRESLGPKYVDPLREFPEEQRAAEIDKIEQELFGDESAITDALAAKTAIVVPSSYMKRGN